MTIYKSDILEWTDEDVKTTVQKVSAMMTSSKSNVRKHKEGSCDVYDIKMGDEKATIVNIKTNEDHIGSWRIFSGKFEQEGIGPFADGSDFDKNFGNGKGIRHTLNNKIATQQALKLHSQGINR